MNPVSWKILFESPAPAFGDKRLRERVMVLRKSGEPLLIVSKGASTRYALALYPAQTAIARLARFVWRHTLPFGWVPGATTHSVLLSPDAPFPEFLREISETSHMPDFAILAGNPHAPGRRFVLLTFDPQGRPVAVVKAGAEPRAIELIEREAAFLEHRPADLPGVPNVQARFYQANISAFAMPFLEGRSPSAGEQPQLKGVLTSWLTRAQTSVPLESLPAWKRLQSAAGADPLFRKIEVRLGQVCIRPALFHGDFAPWNIKASPVDGSWTALDWERGELEGPPGFDWFHFVLQPAMLVQRQAGANLLRTAEQMLTSPRFGSYMQVAGFQGLERQWLLAYLLYCRDVLKPAEGSPRVLELISLLAAHV